MSKDFIPSRDADLLTWAQQNSAKLTATPADFFVTAPIAADVPASAGFDAPELTAA